MNTTLEAPVMESPVIEAPIVEISPESVPVEVMSTRHDSNNSRCVCKGCEGSRKQRAKSTLLPKKERPKSRRGQSAR